MTTEQARQALQACDLHLYELAGGLEPPTCCLQDSCAADCATPAGVQRRVRDQRGGWRRRWTSNRARAPATESLRLSIWPDMGMRTRASQESRTRRWRPVPSLPTTMQTGSSARSRVKRLVSAAAVEAGVPVAG